MQGFGWMKGGTFSVWAGRFPTALLIRALDLFAVEASWADDAESKKRSKPPLPVSQFPQPPMVPVRRGDK